MASIAVVPPISFINIGSPVGTSPADLNNPDDVLILRAFMIYLQNHRRDLTFTSTRLTTLAGSMDRDLSQMINDYKTYKTKVALAALAPEERGNDRVIPQDLRFAIQAALPGASGRSTIMSLNLDVVPLAGYGYSAVEVLCNLFPIRNRLTGATVLPDTYWRDLARNRVAWNKWLRNHQEDAISALNGARDRLADPSRKASLSDEDNEIFNLLNPYQNEMKSFRENHTRISLSTSPNPSAHRQAVVVRISVTSMGGQPPLGSVRLWLADRGLIRVHGRQSVVIPSRAQQLSLVNGSATFTFKELYTSSYLVIAEYSGAGPFLGSQAEVPHEVK